MKVSAEAHAKLFIPDKNGMILYNELKHIEASHGIHDPLLDEAQPPEEAFFVWSLYWEKLRGTGFSMTEIRAWEEITGMHLELWELDLLFIIHRTAENTVYERDYKK